MWREDKSGTVFVGPKEAFKELRARAERAIAQGDRHGFDVRWVRIRLRSDNGAVLFDGTMEEAMRLEINGRVFLPKLPDPSA